MTGGEDTRWFSARESSARARFRHFWVLLPLICAIIPDF